MSQRQDYLRLSSPVSSHKKKILDPTTDAIDKEYLQERLKVLLLTLEAEKEEFESRFLQEKQNLEQKIQEKDERLEELQIRNHRIELENRQLKFNLHQRGSVVEFLKKKVSVLEQKFDTEREEMLSIVKYLQVRNQELTETIFDHKKREANFAEQIYNLEERYQNLASTHRLSLAVNTHRCEDRRLSNQNLSKRNPPNRVMTPKAISKKMLPPQEKQLHRNNSNLDQFTLQFEEDSNIESAEENSVREKTVRYRNGLERIKSEDELLIGMQNQFPGRLSLETRESPSRSKAKQFIGGLQGLQRRDGYSQILINNYGSMRISDVGLGSARNRLRKVPNNINNKMSLLSKQSRSSIGVLQGIYKHS